MHAVAATGARRALMLAVALSCLVSAEAYLRTEKVKTYECDMKEVNAFTAGENQERCKEFCTRVKKTVDDMELDDNGKKKKCRQTAVGLADLMSIASMNMPLSAVEAAVDKIHIDGEPGCLAALMNDWAGRDASCEAAAPGDPKRRAPVVLRRLLLLLTQYYTSSSEVSAHRRELIEEPGADIAARRARRAGSDVPKAKEFCIYQYALFVSNHSQILFDSEHCGGKHPLWSEMESCEKTKCWEKQIEILKDGGGCLALYYDLYFSMVYADGRVKSAGDDERTSTTVASLFPTDSKIPEEACKKKTPPCTSIDAAIKKCAGKDYGSKYSSTVESADAFGNVAKGGVRCWQGSSCH